MPPIDDDDEIAPPDSRKLYLSTAVAMLDGARVLAAQPQVPAVALTYLCGHAAEVSLKALLLHKGVDAKTLKGNGVRHDILALWNLAVGEGVPLENPSPSWVHHLGRVHKTYSVRYPEAHAVALPNLPAMLDGTINLLRLAQLHI